MKMAKINDNLHLIPLLQNSNSLRAGFYYWRDGNLYLQIHITTRAKQNRIVGTYGDHIKIQIAAPPVDGKANAELIKFLAHHFGVIQKDVQLVQGVSSTKKLIRIKKPNYTSL
jgi:uncharacterized protein